MQVSSNCFWGIAVVMVALFSGCGEESSRTVSQLQTQQQSQTVTSAIDLVPFENLARTSICTDIKNRLFLIDGTLVLWDREGNCSDLAYAVNLYGSSVNDLYCYFQDSIAGPVKKCPVADNSVIFATITANLDKPDLGLGQGHTVEQIAF